MMKEEEEDDAMNNNNDVTMNICSYSDSDNNRIGEDDDNFNNINNNQMSKVWGTWEDLVLTCAVKLHGSMDWDSVAKEVQSRVSIDASPGNCEVKFRDLKRRFEDSVAGDGGGGRDNETTDAAAEGEDGEIPWLEKLRSLRVAELRREVQRCDDSILSLQLKVKKLEEEKDENDGGDKPDLEDVDAKSLPARLNRDTTVSNRSMNESNSTASVEKAADDHDGDKLDNSRNLNPDPAEKAEEGSEMSNSGESETYKGRGKRKVRRRSKSGEDNSSVRSGSGGDIKSSSNKSQPLINIIEIIRSHPNGSLFESRLRSQVTKDYKRVIKQHMDIKTIEKKLEKGSYVSSRLCFYRDVKLLFANAIVFFPPSSSESMAAQELRTLVSKEIKKQTGFGKEESESTVSKKKPFVRPPLVVCKQKSSGSKKTTPTSSSKQKDEKKPHEVSEEKTMTTTTTARSSRRTSKGVAVAAKDTKMGRGKSNNKKQIESSDDDDDDEKEESLKTEKKTTSDKKKSMADFLKRIKKNSPEKVKETTSKNPKKSDGNVKKENNGKGKPRELRSSSNVKKKVEHQEENKSSSKRKQQPKKETVATGKRSRESEKESNIKQPNKRSRR